MREEEVGRKSSSWTARVRVRFGLQVTFKRTKLVPAIVFFFFFFTLSYVLTSNISLAKLVCYRKICWCKLEYMVKFH